MTKKRELTKDEIEKIRAYVAEQEKLAYPVYSISVAVKKQTNDEGNPIVNITRMRGTSTGYRLLRCDQQRN